MNVEFIGLLSKSCSFPYVFWYCRYHSVLKHYIYVLVGN